MQRKESKLYLLPSNGSRLNGCKDLVLPALSPHKIDGAFLFTKKIQEQVPGTKYIVSPICTIIRKLERSWAAVTDGLGNHLSRSKNIDHLVAPWPMESK